MVVSPNPQEDEHVFELVTETETESLASYFFVLAHGFEDDESVQSERISGKGELTRKRTIVGAEIDDDDAGFAVQIDVDEANCLEGRVLSVHGLASKVLAANGTTYDCATRGILKTLSTDQRNVVAAGDRVLIQLADNDEAVIERIEPRRGVISRTSNNRQHVIVANVDQLLIVTSAAEPSLKPNLIDRFLVTSDKAEIRPVICIKSRRVRACSLPWRS